jgi:hypothetical protein
LAHKSGNFSHCLFKPAASAVRHQVWQLFLQSSQIFEPTFDATIILMAYAIRKGSITILYNQATALGASLV